MLKAIILIGGPQKGTRFRPLSLDIAKPLFPVAGLPLIQHHIEALAKVPNLKEIFLIGFYQPNEPLTQFISSMIQEYKLSIRYLQEYTALGTAGGVFHFRDQILSGNPESFFVLNGDVCGDFPLTEMLSFHQMRCNKKFTIMATEATRQQSLNYGCMVENKETHEVLHYVEKPSTFVSTLINCGVYLLTPVIFEYINKVFNEKQKDWYSEDLMYPLKNSIWLENDILTQLAGTSTLFVYQTTQWWSQIKSAGAAIYTNRHYLELYQRTHPERLAQNKDGKPHIIGDVFIHPTANVHPTAVLGPNVSISKGVTVGLGVRIRESIILGDATLQDHCCVLHSIVGWNSVVGEWSRVEGTPNDPNPNKPFAKLESSPLFNNDGRLNPSITILGRNVQVPAEVIVLNSIVLPYKDLTCSYKNQIIL